MITGVVSGPAVRGLPWLVVGSGLLALASGCGEGYSDDMTYGLRTDALVISVQKATPPTTLDPPGQLAELSKRIANQGGTVLDPAKVLNEAQRNKLQSSLEKTFGKPAHPTVATTDAEAVKSLQLDPKTLANGGALFRRHCLHCHGLTGNGLGPTAPWVNPHPRDYRKGLFKFVSTRPDVLGRKPSRQDLLRVLRQGIDGTSMPAFGAISGGTFGVLSDEELNLLVSYVIHLSMRGQTEYESIQNVVEEQEAGSQPNLDEIVPAKFQGVVEQWVAAAGDAQIAPVSVKDDKDGADLLKKVADLAKNPPGDKTAFMKQLHEAFDAMPFTDEDIEEAVRPLKLTDADMTQVLRQSRQASIERGYKMFTGSACAQCHLDFGRKDNLLWDDWGTIVRPANLTLGMYRGGRRPVDLYWRIHDGIPGANMPANSELTKGPDGKDHPWRLWDLVNFVQAVPYRKMLPDNIAEAVHPQHAHHEP